MCCSVLQCDAVGYGLRVKYVTGKAVPVWCVCVFLPFVTVCFIFLQCVTNRVGLNNVDVGGLKRPSDCSIVQPTAAHCNPLQSTATHCISLQQPATYCKTDRAGLNNVDARGLGRLADCNTLQHTATHCNTLQHLQPTATHYLQPSATHRNPPQPTATHCNLLQYTAIPCNIDREGLNNVDARGLGRLSGSSRFPTLRQNDCAYSLRQSLCVWMRLL